MGTHHTDALLRLPGAGSTSAPSAACSNPCSRIINANGSTRLPRDGLGWRVRTAAALLTAVLSVAPRALFLTPTPPSMLRRIVARMILFMSVVTGLMLIPFLIEFGNSPFVDAGAIPRRRFAEIMLGCCPR